MTRRIVRPVPAAPGQDTVRSRRYEIFHDVLASTINRAIAARDEQRRVRRFRRLAALAVALLVIVVGRGGGVRLSAEQREHREADGGVERAIADADLDVTRDPELSTSLALQALKLRPLARLRTLCGPHCLTCRR